MKETADFFKTLKGEQLSSINGGGFAYDVGRVIRFLVMSGGGQNPFLLANATADWIINDAVNDALNN
jgi:hypothetical protein